MILTITESISEIIETDKEPWSTYRRFGPNHWEVLMGESWESCYTSEEELELEYQQFKQTLRL